ncbi:hypothetical protein Tco_1088084 [Tanacetum coccineum]
MPFIEEGGSAPNIPCFKSFVIPEGQLTQENVVVQLKEMKRLADLKAEIEKSEKSLRKFLNPTIIKAQTQNMAEHEAKRKKMFDEYNQKGMVIKEPESGVYFYNGNFDLAFQREEEFHLATKKNSI